MSKYNARRTLYDGVWFDSQKEQQRYVQLKLMLKAGKITDLELQPRYDIHVNNKYICFYKADFSYNDENTNLVVEDVKSPMTAKLPVYRLKKKLLRACHGIDIVEV
ncbi:MAG: DUF1064 domain-containing protein [Candidatus Sabulitectum sp.]|nr:DUF1064 domain-containing protein [Candidatus Sabulitectum sp.]